MILPKRVSRDIEDENLVDRLEFRVLFELPHDLFVTRDFECQRLLANVTVTEVIAEYGVSVW